MSLRSRIVRAVQAFADGSITSSRELMAMLLRREMSDSGVAVTPDSAMRTQAVYACVRVLSEDIASLPLPLYRRLPRGKERVTNHWLWDLLQQPNPWQTGFEFRELVQSHLELNGNFYALKTVVRDEVRELIPITPWRVTVSQGANYRLSYGVTWPDGTTSTVPAERMLHVAGLSLDGITGLSPIGYLRETIGLSLSMQRYGARLFKGGAMIGGILKHPATLSDDAAKRLKDSFDEQYSGVDNAWKTLLLEEGLEFVGTGMKAEEAQFLESRKFSRTEIAGAYRVPPHLIGDLERATFSNIEEQARGYVQYGLLPRLRRLEARLTVSLMPPAMRREYFVEHLVEGMLRGDYAKRMAGYQQAVTSGWMTRNEVRELENLNPGPAQLDEFLEPAHITGAAPADPSSSDHSNDPAPDPAAARSLAA